MVRPSAVGMPPKSRVLRSPSKGMCPNSGNPGMGSGLSSCEDFSSSMRFSSVVIAASRLRERGPPASVSPAYGRTAKGRLPRTDGPCHRFVATGRQYRRRRTRDPAVFAPSYDAFAKATDEASTGRAGSRIQSFMLPAYRYSLL